jgi:hypothetical protein
MPGLGPHAGGTTRGRGFWAQQGFYGVQQIDYGPFILRGWLKSLPDQPPPPNAFQSWTWSYNLNLIGQDRLPTGDQSTDLTSAQRPYELSRFHSWTQSLNLSGFYQAPGQPLPGDQIYALASAHYIPFRIEQTWAASYNKNLIGKDQLPVGENVFELPRDVQRSLDLRTWLQTTTALTMGPPRPIVQSDWPLPIPQSRIDQFWAARAQLVPIPPDTTHILRPIWRSLPDQPAQPLLQQSPFPNLVIRAVIVLLPNGQQRVELAPSQVVPRLDQTWTWSYNQNLIGQDKLPTGEQFSELPPRDFARLFQTWINAVNLSLATAPPNLFAQARQQDWPLPRGAEPDWRRSWEWAYNKNLIGQDVLPFRQSDWQLTPAAYRQPDLSSWIDRVKLQLIKPFAQLDWPNPTPLAREPTLATWTRGYNLNLIGQDQLPTGEQSTDLAPRDFSRLLQTWIQTVNLALTVAAAQVPKNQYDWPNPGQPPREPGLTSWTGRYNLNLIGKDQLPIGEALSDLPPRDYQRILQTWIQSVNIALFSTIRPFAQFDWPNPAGHTLPTLLQTWYYSRAALYPPPTFPPGEAFFDRPQLRPDTAADLYFWRAYYPIIPPFVPTFGASYRLLADHYLYGFYYRPNTIITEGREIPFGWVPTLAVDPLNSLAVTAYYNAGPRSTDYGDLSTYTNMYKREFADVPVNSPITFWKQVPGTKMYQLQGLGIGTTPVGSS